MEMPLTPYPKNLEFKVYTRFDRPAPAGHVTSLPSETDQSQFQSTDINYLVTCMREGYDVADRMYSDKPQMYYDTTAILSFEQQVTMQANIRSDFMSMSAEHRAMFDNDVSTFVGAMCDPENWEALTELGLLEVAKSVQSVIEPNAATRQPAGDFAPKAKDADVADPE